MVTGPRLHGGCPHCMVTGPFCMVPLGPDGPFCMVTGSPSLLCILTGQTEGSPLHGHQTGATVPCAYVTEWASPLCMAPLGSVRGGHPTLCMVISEGCAPRAWSLDQSRMDPLCMVTGSVKDLRGLHLLCMVTGQ